MSVDGEFRELPSVDHGVSDAELTKQPGFIAGSNAVDALHRMITSVESFFHPTNAGTWSIFVRLTFISEQVRLIDKAKVGNLYSTACI
jgi:hypothetical protein